MPNYVKLSFAVLMPCALAAVAPAVSAQARDQEARALSPVVVTATGSAVEVRDAPASVSVITREEIERQPIYDLATLLRRVPGVTGGLSPQGEQSKIKLRGLPNNYTLILIDGKRQGSSSDVHYRADLGRQDLNWISPDMIERIEIVRGPMSSLYGSDAMGGVINIITRKIAKTWSGSVSAAHTRPQDSNRGDASRFGLNLSGPLTDSLSIRLGSSFSRQNPDETTGGGNGGMGGERNENYNALLNWTLNKDHLFSLEASRGVQRATESSARDPEYPDYPAQSGFGASKLNQTGFALGHEGDWGVAKSKLRVYRNDYKNDISADNAAFSRAESSLLTVDGSLDIPAKLIFEQLITVGGQWKREELTNTDTIGTLPFDYAGRRVSGASLEGDTSALFVEDQIFLRDNLTLTLGNRVDHHEKFGTHNSPRAYVVYHPEQAWTIRGGVSKGFRAPSLKESSAGAATNSGGRGCTSLRSLGYVRGQCYMAGNPDLQPETSNNYEIGTGFNPGNGLDLGLTYFHTDFRNKIEYAPLGRFYGIWWTKMGNIQKARTRGLEGTATLPLARGLDWRSNLTYMFESKNLSTGANLLSVPKLSLYSALGWKVNDKLSADLSLQYTGKEQGTARAFLKAYTTFDLSAAWQVNQTLTLRGGIENLTDKKVMANGASNYYVPGRRFFVGLTSSF